MRILCAEKNLRRPAKRKRGPQAKSKRFVDKLLVKRGSDVQASGNSAGTSNRRQGRIIPYIILETLSNPQACMEYYEILWNPLESIEILWNPMKSY